MNKALAESPIRHVSDAASGLYIEHVRDLSSGTEDRILTCGGGVRVRGSKMKLAGNDPTVGITLINADGDHFPVAAAAIMRNGPRVIDFICPLVEEGEYRLMLTTMFSVGTLLKEARSYIFPAVLTVR
ncbi:hypothetical protein AGMMS49942_23110 [Spirochaetia bacterium]|nr:hypothetical protein AGMMS49942_23110 [Spirochaetia bacterium]